MNEPEFDVTKSVPRASPEKPKPKSDLFADLDQFTKKMIKDNTIRLQTQRLQT